MLSSVAAWKLYRYTSLNLIFTHVVLSDVLIHYNYMWIFLVPWIRTTKLMSMPRSRSEVEGQGHRVQSKFYPNFPDHNSRLNSQMATKWYTSLEVAQKRCPFVFSCDQAALWMVQSVRLSVCLSHLFDYVPIIVSSWNFEELLPMIKVTSMQKGQGQRSKVKVTEVNTQLNHFRIVTPVWIHIWWWNYAYSLMMLRRGALLFFKVVHQISRSHGSKKRRIWPRLDVSGL